MILYILGFFGILIPLVYLGPHPDPARIWTEFNNGGNWPTQACSFFVGTSGNAFAFLGWCSALKPAVDQVLTSTTGADSVYHVGQALAQTRSSSDDLQTSEEIHDSPTTVPKSMILALIINGVVGLGMGIAVLASTSDFNAALKSDYVQV